MILFSGNPFSVLQEHMHRCMDTLAAAMLYIAGTHYIYRHEIHIMMMMHCISRGFCKLHLSRPAVYTSNKLAGGVLHLQYCNHPLSLSMPCKLLIV